ncbi:heme peroxidase [Tothia fuscella]|uniref:Peroxidase n=1 Tax=Tothia fuscella TaxID=1048955 RepID=A0A9P4NHK3_9PEZI|nr:heme peroxidase [Tothia fuscella]
MHFFNSFLAIGLVASTQAISFPSILTPRASCPAVWTQISADLTKLFVTGLTCNDNARAAIRGVFHDCFPQGGCDGSLALFPEELSRSENSPMTATMNALKALAVKHNVGVADMLMFAGSHAVISCPGGPKTTTYIGRTDATGPAPTGQLPAHDVPAAAAKARFAAKGFSSQDLAALIGSHSTSKQFLVDPKRAGASQDSTPGIWDILYYGQLILKLAPFSFIADKNLLADADTGKYMKTFSVSKRSWDDAFAPAMAKMELLGPEFTKVDCTGALPRSLRKRGNTQSYARSIINSLSLGKLAAE